MPTTTYIPRQTAYPLVVPALVVQIKATYGGTWATDPELEVVSLNACSAGADLGEGVFRRRYGILRQPYETVDAVHPPVDLDGWWIRVVTTVDSVTTTLWTGIVAADTRDVFGTDSDPSSPVAAGNQEYTAYEPAVMLRRTMVSESDWIMTEGETSSAVRLGWIPPMNLRNAHHTLVGNRSTSLWTADDPDSVGCYLFGGTEPWTRRQFVTYLLQRFATVDGGPIWRLSSTGAASALDTLTDSIRWGESMKLNDMIRQCIPQSMGLDYRIVEVSGGFELRVFSLSSTAITFAGSTLPANAELIEWVVSDALDLLETKVVRSAVRQFSKIRVIGRRMVVAFSLDALIPGWTHTGDGNQQSEYEAGTGTPADEASAHDAARRRDEMREVFQRYTAPAAFDLDAVGARPTIEADGTVDFETAAPYQNQVRRTLTWLPIRQGVDYSGGPPENDPSVELLPPAAYVQDPELGRYIPVDAAGMSLSVLTEDWGIQLGANPNHLMALNHWGAGAAETEADPKYDYDTLVCTIAIESDHRLMLEYELEGGDGSVMVVEDDTAELWVLADDTIIGIDPAAGTLVRSVGGHVLRNDSGRLGLLMAGAVARYGQPRGRASITLSGWHNFVGMIGSILTVVDSGGDPQQLDAPVTSVRWTGGDPQTVISAGFAG